MSLLHAITTQTAATAKRGRGWNLLYKSLFGRENRIFASGIEHQNYAPSSSAVTLDALAVGRQSSMIMMNPSTLLTPFRVVQGMLSELGNDAFWWSSTLKKRKKKMNKHKLKKRRKRERSKAGKKNT